jgi:hypothetical protein
MSQAFSLLGPMNTRPYAIGERPGGSYIPTIPLLSGQTGWDSLTPYYTSRALDTHLEHFGHGGPRVTDHPLTKKANGLMTLTRGLSKPGVPPIDPKVYARLFPKIDLSKSRSTGPGFWDRAKAVAAHPATPGVVGAGAVGGSGLAMFGGALAAGNPVAAPQEGVGEGSGLPKGTPDTTSGETGPIPGPGLPKIELPESLQKLVGGVGDPGQIAQFAGKNWGALLGGGMGLAGLAYLLNKRRQAKQREKTLASMPFVMKSAEDVRVFALEHPLVAGFLRRCGEAKLNDRQIITKIAAACRVDPSIKAAFDAAGTLFDQRQPPQSPNPMIAKAPQPNLAGDELAKARANVPPPGSPQGGKLVGSPSLPDKPMNGPSLYGHYADQAFNPNHDWSQDPTDAPGDAALRTGARVSGAVGGAAGLAAGGIAATPLATLPATSALGAAGGAAARTAGGLAGQVALIGGAQAIGQGIHDSLGGNQHMDMGMGEMPPAVDGNGQPITTPEQAKQHVAETGQKIQEAAAQNPEIKNTLAEANKTQQAPPSMTAGAAQNLLNEPHIKAMGATLQDAWQHVSAMPWQQQAPLWLGLGLGTYGLLHGLFGKEGGIGDWLMGLVGLGTAAGMAARGGAFGQGAQQAVHGAVGGIGNWLNGMLQGKAGPQQAGGQPAATLSEAPKVEPSAMQGVMANHSWLTPHIGGGDDPHALDKGDQAAILKAFAAGQIKPEQMQALVQEPALRPLIQHGVDSELDTQRSGPIARMTNWGRALTREQALQHAEPWQRQLYDWTR